MLLRLCCRAVFVIEIFLLLKQKPKVVVSLWRSSELDEMDTGHTERFQGNFNLHFLFSPEARRGSRRVAVIRKRSVGQTDTPSNLC